MQTYSVTYPHSRDLDKDVPWTYLEGLARDRKREGARATCTNGERVTYVLRNGEWVRESR